MPNDSNLLQIANRILPSDVCDEIKAGTMSSDEAAYNLVVLIADCEAYNDASTSMTQRRLSKQLTALAGLIVLALDRCGSGSAGAK
jgi:hypothetical protein